MKTVIRILATVVLVSPLESQACPPGQVLRNTVMITLDHRCDSHLAIVTRRSDGGKNPVCVEKAEEVNILAPGRYRVCLKADGQDGFVITSAEKIRAEVRLKNSL